MLEKELVCQNEIHPYYSSTKHEIYTMDENEFVTQKMILYLEL